MSLVLREGLFSNIGINASRSQVKKSTEKNNEEKEELDPKTSDLSSKHKWTSPTVKVLDVHSSEGGGTTNLTESSMGTGGFGTGSTTS